MNIQDVIKACGPLQQAPQVIPVGSKKGNGLIIVVLILSAGIGYLIYREWTRKNDLEKKYRFVSQTKME
jgi:hypothetical protein